MAAALNATSPLLALAVDYLRPWSSRGGVSLAMVDDAHLRWADYRDPDWGKFVPPREAHNRLLRVNILGGRLYYYTCTSEKHSPKRYARELALLELIDAAIAAHGAPPDVDLVLSISDRPTVPRAAAGDSPPLVFAYSTSPYHHAVPFPPVTFAPRRWAALHRKLGTHPPLAEREQRALWRGTCNSLCDGRQPPCSARRRRDAALMHRRMLLDAAARCPKLADVGIVKPHKNCAGFAQRQPVPMRRHAEFAFVAHVDGNGFSGRLDELLTLGGVVLKQASPFSAFYYPLLRPGVHYAPLHRNGSDLCAAIAALRSDPPRAAAIAAAATSLARAVLSPASVLAYVSALLRGYATLQRFTPRRHPHAKPWRPPRQWPSDYGLRQANAGAAGDGASAAAAAGQAEGGGRRRAQHLRPARGPTLAHAQDEAGACSSLGCCRRHPKAAGCTRRRGAYKRL